MRRVKEASFLTPDARQAFTQLKQTFTKAPILQHFDTKRYIQIEIDASGYAIGGIFSLITSEIGQWYSVSYYSQKMILAKTHYEMHDAELIAIIKAFKS